MKETIVREPKVAGQFYPATAESLHKQIEAFTDKQAKKKDVAACMLPHAGYLYSGYVATQTVSRINIKDRVILLGPNHTGTGEAFSIMSEGAWRTPLGEVGIDQELAKCILSNSDYLCDCSSAHADEHSLEVELPILQYFRKDFKIVPIAFLSDELDTLKKIGKEIATCLIENKVRDSVLILASSDMTHYESKTQAERKDRLALDAILGMDEDKLFKTIIDHKISMCGYAPVAVMLCMLKAFGVKNGQLIKYQTSAEATHDTSSVVGYAGAVFY